MNFFEKKFSGETGKRHRFSEVVTVNRSGETGRRFGKIFSEFFLGETGRRNEFFKVVSVNRSGETGRGVWIKKIQKAFEKKRETTWI